MDDFFECLLLSMKRTEMIIAISSGVFSFFDNNYLLRASSKKSDAIDYFDVRNQDRNLDISYLHHRTNFHISSLTSSSSS